MRVLTKLLGKAALLLSVAAVSGEPGTVAACSCAVVPIYESDPKAGATEVELNRAVLITGNFLKDGIVFEEASGQPVAFDVTHGPTAGCPGIVSELIPREPLHPNTQYRVRVRRNEPRSDGDDHFEFKTGTRMLSDPPLRTPHAIASTLSSVPSDGFGCSDGSFFTCVWVDDSEDVEIIARRGDKTVLRWVAHDVVDGAFAFQQAPDCVEVRRRSPTGKRSEPYSICGDALRERPFQETDRDQNKVLLCEHGMFGVNKDTMSLPMLTETQPSAGSGATNARAQAPQPSAAAHADTGCAIAHTPAPGAHRFALAAGFLALWLATRRRSRRI